MTKCCHQQKIFTTIILGIGNGQFSEALENSVPNMQMKPLQHWESEAGLDTLAYTWCGYERLSREPTYLQDGLFNSSIPANGLARFWYEQFQLYLTWACWV